MSYKATPREDPNKGRMKLKFTMILRNIEVLRAFNKWRNVDKARVAKKFAEFKAKMKSMYNQRSLDSHANVKTVRQRLLEMNKYRHDQIYFNNIQTKARIREVEQELNETRKECHAVLKKKYSAKIALTRQKMAVKANYGVSALI